MMLGSMPYIWCLWENNRCLAIVRNLDIFQRHAPVPWRTVRFPGFVTATAPHTYVWSFQGLPWPQGRPICIKSSVFLWQISTTRWAKNGGCDRYKGFFWKKWAQIATSWRTEVWNQHVYTIGSNKLPVYRGNLNFFYFPLSACQSWRHPLVEDRQPTYFTNLKRPKDNPVLNSRIKLQTSGGGGNPW